MKRLGILSIDETTGTGFRYLTHLLGALSAVIDSFVVVLCGQPNDELETLVQAYAHKVLHCKAPHGMLGLYEAGFAAVCSDGIPDVDEIVFLSHRLFGPILDMQKVFDEMSHRENLGVWGITSAQVSGQSCLEPYFFVARRRTFTTGVLKKLLSHGAARSVAGGSFESCARSFTHALEVRGIAWRTLIDTTCDEQPVGSLTEGCSSANNPFDLVVNRGMPFVRHESFELSRSARLRFGTQGSLSALLEYLNTQGTYDVSLMAEYMLPRMSLEQVRVFGDYVVIPPRADVVELAGGAVALVRVEDDLASTVLSKIPPQMDLIVVSDTLDDGMVNGLHKGVNTLVRADGGSGFEVFFEDRRAADWLSAYRYLCYIEPGCRLSAPYPTARQDFLQYMLDNLLEDSGYVGSVVGYFARHPWVGVLCSPHPSFSIHFGDALISDAEGDPHFSEALKELGCDAHLDGAHSIASWGFWCLTDVLKQYVGASALARRSVADSLPYVAQAHGMVSCALMSQKHCDAEFANDAFMVSSIATELAKASFAHVPTFETYVATVSGRAGYEAPAQRQCGGIGLSGWRKVVKKLGGSLNKGSEAGVQEELDSFIAHPHYNEGMEGAWKKNKQLAVALSPVRKNVVRWIPFKRNDVVVELGGSYGELTSYIAPQVARLYACEREGCRQSIIRERCRGMSNVEVIDKSHCVAVLSGLKTVNWLVVHNIDGLFDEGHEFESFLRTALDVTRPQNVAIMGANRHGVRYPTEARYIEGDEAKASSRVLLDREDLSETLGSAGLGDMRFFYPYPDHVFCKTLYSDERLPDAPDLMEGVWRLSGQRLQDADERLELTNAAAERRFADRANSLMVIASREPDQLEMRLPICVRFPSDRKERFSMQTSFLPGGVVRKECITSSALGHLSTARMHTDALRKMYAKGGIVLDDIVYREDCLEYAYVPGRSLHSQCVALIDSGKTDLFLKEFETFIERLKLAHDEGFFTASWQFQEVFGTPNLPVHLRCSLVSNIDMNLDNFIIGDDGRVHLIDCEWIFSFPIPCLFIIWRAVFFFFEKINCENSDTFDGLRSRCFEMAGINDELALTFRQMERSFQRYMGV